MILYVQLINKMNNVYLKYYQALKKRKISIIKIFAKKGRKICGVVNTCTTVSKTDRHQSYIISKQYFLSREKEGADLALY